MITFKRDALTHELNLIFGKDEHAFIHTTNDWRQFYRCLTGKSKYNWYGFHILHFSFENDVICPGFEIEIAILGLGLRFRTNRSLDGTDIQTYLEDAERGIKANSLIPGGFSGKGEFSEELDAALGAMIGMVQEGMTEQEQEHVASLINTALNLTKLERKIDEYATHA